MLVSGRSACKTILCILDDFQIAWPDLLSLQIFTQDTWILRPSSHAPASYCSKKKNCRRTSFMFSLTDPLARSLDINGQGDESAAICRHPDLAIEKLCFYVERLCKSLISVLRAMICEIGFAVAIKAPSCPNRTTFPLSMLWLPLAAVGAECVPQSSLKLRQSKKQQHEKFLVSLEAKGYLKTISHFFTFRVDYRRKFNRSISRFYLMIYFQCAKAGLSWLFVLE